MGKRFKKAAGRAAIAAAAVLAIGFAMPERKGMPAGKPGDFNKKSFWYWPWTRGKAGSPHAGVDIFGREGAPVVSQTGGIVLYAGWLGGVSGNAVFVLGPKWRVHVYLHLKRVDADFLDWASPGEQIATLGRTGNARRTPPHVHYQIATLIPYPWLYGYRNAVEGIPAEFDWMTMFLLNPADHLPKVE